MAAQIKFDDGKVVVLSEETTKRLRKELIKDDKQLIADRFRAVKSPIGDGVRLAIMGYNIMSYDEDKWDGHLSGSNARAVCYSDLYETRKIIAGLSRMIGE